MAFFTEQRMNPKRKFRWVVEFGTGSGIFTVAAKQAAKPSYKLDSTAHKFINHTFNYPNRVIWEPIQITFVDHIGHSEADSDGSVTSQLYNLLLQTGYQIPRNPRNCELSPTKSNATAALNSIRIIQLSGDDGVSGNFNAIPDESERLETWTLGRPFISGVKFGDLSYDSDDLVDITCDIVYDYAEYKPGA